MGKLTEHFTDEEMACHCCGVAKMNPYFMAMLESARFEAGVGFTIESGYRCLKHEFSKEVKGTGANHPHGEAADIVCPDGPTRRIMMKALIAAGFNRIGIGSNFLHCDISDKTRGLPQSFWDYYPKKK